MSSISMPTQGQLCRRLTLVHASSGDLLFPVAIKSRATGDVGWYVSPGGTGGNCRAVAREVHDEDELIRLVTVQGMSVRACTADRRRKGLYSPHGRSIARVERLAP